MTANVIKYENNFLRENNNISPRDEKNESNSTKGKLIQYRKYTEEEIKKKQRNYDDDDDDSDDSDDYTKL